ITTSAPAYGWTNNLNTAGFTTINRGIVGETSTQIAARMIAATELYSAGHVIWCGRNDYSSGWSPAIIAGILANIASMVAVIPHTRFLILSMHNEQGVQHDTGEGL